VTTNIHTNRKSIDKQWFTWECCWHVPKRRFNLSITCPWSWWSCAHSLEDIFNAL